MSEIPYPCPSWPERCPECDCGTYEDTSGPTVRWPNRVAHRGSRRFSCGKEYDNRFSPELKSNDPTHSHGEYGAVVRLLAGSRQIGYDLAIRDVVKWQRAEADLNCKAAEELIDRGDVGLARPILSKSIVQHLTADALELGQWEDKS